ncbi:MAG: glycoside hydrolase family 88/105 protein [Planctomycetota bacterium]
MNRSIHTFITMFFCFLAAFSTFGCRSPEMTEKIYSKENIITVMNKVNDYTFAHPYKENDRDWIRSTYYTGVMALYETTQDPNILYQAMRWAQKHDWAEGPGTDPACKMTCGQTYLKLYLLKNDPKMFTKIRVFADSQIKNADAPARKVWDYCDSLYVGPPTLAMLGRATGRQKYYKYLNEVYWDVTDYLLDEEYGLFYRDKRYFEAKTKNNKKIFWARGNGWVIAGIPRVLEYLPKNNPYYDNYVDLLDTMAAAIAKLQGKDGLWRTNLTDPDQYPMPETSCSTFFCYAMAWGINNGYLDRQKYLPVVTKTWRGLVNAVHPDGKLGWVQPPAYEPGPVRYEDTHEYAAGAFLLAGSEVIKLNLAARD